MLADVEELQRREALGARQFGPTKRPLEDEEYLLESPLDETLFELMRTMHAPWRPPDPEEGEGGKPSP
jgi:hypothetical protein